MGRSRISFGAVGAVLAGLCVAVTAGCGRDCRSSSLTIVSVTSAGSITARLTSDGDPVSGKQINFIVDSEGVSGKTGQNAGSSRTGDDGRATVSVPRGLAAFVGPGDRPTAVRVEFSELGGSEAYCSAKARRSLG